MGVIGEKLSQIDFRTFIDQLNTGGWFQYVFPFMLVYAVVLTILNQVKVFEDRKSVKVIVAMIFALFAIAFPISDNTSCGLSSARNMGYTSGGCTLGDMMMTLFPGVTAFTLAILALYIVAAMLGVDLMHFFGNNNRDNWLRYVLGALGVLVVGYYYARGFGWGGFGSGSEIEEFFKDPVLYIIVLFGLFFWYITNEDTSSERTAAAATRARNAAREAEHHSAQHDNHH